MDYDLQYLEKIDKIELLYGAGPISMVPLIRCIINLCELSICGIIKQNESEFTNIDLEIEPHKGNKSFCFLLF